MLNSYLDFELPLQVQMRNVKEHDEFTELKIPKTKKIYRPFVCMKCGRSYSRKDSLMRHVRWECGKEPLFQCPFCPQRCKRKPHWMRHIRRQHFEKIGDIEHDLLAYTPKID
ncbi:hypothetical protein PV326_001081 [Microctonus aethiopoides]|nr:hypothetical protein PV326_001081 [Microctonus aethiopoides]